MLIHASCAARDGQGVLLLGAPGSGKSDLVLRLLSTGFQLVADDQVVIDENRASPPTPLAGLLEVRGLGIFRLPHLASAPLALAVQLGYADRLPDPATHHLGIPLVTIDPAAASAPHRVSLALDAALGHVTQVAGSLERC